MTDKERIEMLKEYLVKNYELMQSCEASFALSHNYAMADHYNCEKNVTRTIYDMLCDDKFLEVMLKAVTGEKEGKR